MQNIRLLFDGIEQDLDNIRGTNGASFTYRSKDENGENGFAFSPDLLLTGAAYDYVKAQIIEQPLPALAQIKVLVYSACCSDALGNPLLLFTGKIDGADVEWCEYPCNECTVSIIDDSQDAQAIQCLKNAIIWERKPKFDGSGNTLGDDTERQAIYLSYCNDVRPAFLQEVFMIFGFVIIVAITPLLFVFATIVTAINQLISIVGGIPLANPSYYDDVIDIINTLTSIVTGCGYKHRTPFVSSILSNACELCGLSLQSSLFGIGGPYRNTVRLDAAFVAGRRDTNTANSAWVRNRPNLNFIQFLDEFNQFNIDWRVSNGVLIIERKDYDFAGQWFDLADIPNDDVLSLCFSVTDKKPPAYGEYEYTKDGVDNTGDEARDTWTDLVFDWNTPPNPAQSGLLRRSFFYGTALFRMDGARSETSPLDKPLFSAIFSILNDTENVMLMEKGICGFPKLLIWDGTSDVENAKVLRYPSAVEPNTFDYNIDWWVKKDYEDGTGTPRDTLYQRLFYIDDPRVTGVKIRGFTLEINANCDILATLSPDKNIVIPVSGVNKTAAISEIQYNVNTNKLTITGLV
jgi:hypothetical protein